MNIIKLKIEDVISFIENQINCNQKTINKKLKTN